MRYGVFSVRDKKCDYYAPRVESNKDSAKRWFSSVVNTPGTMLNYAPEDFSLYQIGEFDSEEGVLYGYCDIDFVCKGDSVKKGDAQIEKS